MWIFSEIPKSGKDNPTLSESSSALGQVGEGNFADWYGAVIRKTSDKTEFFRPLKESEGKNQR